MAVQSLPNLLRPLAKRTRAAAITQELEQLSRLTRPQLRERMRDTHKETRLRYETLVSLARTLTLAGDIESANLALSSLVQCVSPTIINCLNRWNISAQNRLDIKQDVILGLLQYWQDMRPTEELWECNFTTPFNTRIWSLIKSTLPKSVQAQSLSTLTDEGDDQEREDWLADTRSMSVQDQAMLYHAMRALHEENKLLSTIFHAKHVLGLKEEEIAADQGVSSRTIRTRLREAERFLQTHLREERV